ncbi:MAG: AMP-binding protein [Spirochaetales bacterium]|nr:AMP-binding protein [Spirochaetales bacterium]
MKETINNVLFQSIEKNFARKAFSHYSGDESLTYLELGRSVTGISLWLISQGIQPGDKVALLGESSLYWPQVYFAVTTMGAVLVPILPDFQAEEISKILSHSESKLLFLSQKQKEKMDKAGCDLSMVVLEELPSENEEGMELLDKYRSEVEEDSLAAILYTSGTTGNSKGVMLSHKNFVSNAKSASLIPKPRLKTGHVWLSLLPLAHTYECTIGMIINVYTGGHTYYLGRPPVPSIIVKALKKLRPRVILSVPLLIEKIYSSSIKPNITTGFLGSLYKVPFMRRPIHWLAGRKLYKTFGGRLSFFGVGGAPLSAEVEKFLRDARFPYSIGYGLTETSPLLAGSPPLKGAFRSTGKVLERVEIRLAEEGEIQARGPNIMQGYYKNEEMTKEVMTEDGWFRTGDIGEFDRRGNLFIKGRIKNVILGANGENIYPESIESVINAEPFVEESLVLEGGGGLTALVHFNYERVVEELQRLRYQHEHRGEGKEFHVEGDKKGWIPSAEEVSQFMEKYRASLTKTVNTRLSVFSRISHVKEESEPFIRTPTKKIKRFLYDHMGRKDKDRKEETSDDSDQS